MTDLKLIALDSEDLDILAAHTQDATVRVGDMGYARADRRFALIMNRYAWEDEPSRPARAGVRKRAGMHFEQVDAVRFSGFDPHAAEGVLNLLTIRFVPTEAPAGRIELTFAGGGAIHLDVEVLEARLADLGAAWAARTKPEHAA
jgi:hypothetical protein